ncbi:hypothetical protein [Streptomyces antimycoticus]|uniref:hypothetical protein n=1 Tax=Streptomyces antimycoticus TaxID=68175 RepID=UPI000A3B658E|nr:hypothetical protein [Streptomyces antimycoticus]
MTKNQTEVRVREVSATDLPPIPDMAVVDRWMQQRKTQPGLPVPREQGAGHYQQIVLDTRTGELRFHCEDWTRRQSRTEIADSQQWTINPITWVTVPRVLYWIIQSGVDELPYLTAEEGNALAHRIAPTAQDLLDHLRPIPGTDELDWSAAAITAGHAVDQMTDRPGGTHGYGYALVDMERAVAVLPGMVRRHWAELPDAELDQAAEDVNRLAGCNERWWPELPSLLGLENRKLRVVGTRAWLYQHRLDRAGGRTPVDADKWLTLRYGMWVGPASVPADAEEPPPSLISTDDDTQALIQAAEIADGAAHAQGIRLLNTVDVLHRFRREMRVRLVEELDTFGRRRKSAENELAKARTATNSRILQIIGWGDPSWDNDAELARRAQMSRQAVNKLRDQLTDPVYVDVELHDAGGTARICHIGEGWWWLGHGGDGTYHEAEQTYDDRDEARDDAHAWLVEHDPLSREQRAEQDALRQRADEFAAARQLDSNHPDFHEVFPHRTVDGYVDGDGRPL